MTSRDSLRGGGKGKSAHGGLLRLHEGGGGAQGRIKMSHLTSLAHSVRSVSESGEGDAEMIRGNGVAVTSQSLGVSRGKQAEAASSAVKRAVRSSSGGGLVVSLAAPASGFLMPPRKQGKGSRQRSLQVLVPASGVCVRASARLRVLSLSPSLPPSLPPSPLTRPITRSKARRD